MKYFLFILLFLPAILFSEEMKFDITYLGINIVTATFKLSSDNDSLSVYAYNNSISRILKKMNNHYTATYPSNDSLFLPKSYKKDIDQKSYVEYRIVQYERMKKRAFRTDYLKVSKKYYTISTDVRDFFSTLMYLRTNKADEINFNLDVNSALWNGKSVFLKDEIVKMGKRQYACKKYKITYKKETFGESENTDMLTNNLVGKNKVLYLWFTDDKFRVPIKSKFAMKPFSVYWKLKEYKN